MRRVPIALLLIGCMLAAPWRLEAQRRGENPDWPCQQRLVPSLTAGTFWSGPSLDGSGDWQAEPKVAALVRQITPRKIAAEQGEAAIAAFADGLGAESERGKTLTLAFAGLLEETNRERAGLIERILELGRRQRELAEIATKAGEELHAIPESATGEEAARRSEIEQRFGFVTRAFESTQRTMRYACEAPVQLEARLGRYARALEAKL
jgi:hypothetical protein